VGAGEQCVAKGGDCGNGDHSAPAKACCDGGPCQPWWPGTPDGRPYGYQCAKPTVAAELRGVVGGNATVMVGAGEQCVAKGGDCGNGDHSAPAKACCDGGPCQPWWPGTPDGRPYGYQCASPPAPDVPCLPARSDCSKGGSCCDGMECQTTTGADGTIFGERCVYP